MELGPGKEPGCLQNNKKPGLMVNLLRRINSSVRSSGPVKRFKKKVIKKLNPRNSLK